MGKITLLLICALIVFGCGNNTQKKQLASDTKMEETSNPEIVVKDSSPKIINIEEGFKEQREFKLSEIASDIEYVKLETTPESYIGGGNSTVVIGSNYFFIYNKKRLLQFSRNGEFVKEIGRNGRGPGEFASTKGIAIDETTKNIYVIANFGHKVLEYNYETGKFMGSFPIDEIAGSTMLSGAFQLIEKDKFAVLSHPLTQFRPDYFFTQIIDKNGHLIKNKKSSLFSVDDDEKIKNKSFQVGNQTWKFKNEMRFFERLNDTIYQYEYNKFIPIYIFELGKYKGSFDIMVARQDERKDRYISLHNILETNNFLFFHCRYNKERLLCMYDKKNGEMSKISNPQTEHSWFYNDIDGGLPFFPRYLNEIDFQGEWIFMHTAIDMKQKLTDEHIASSEAIFPEKKKELQKIITGLKIDDNPVLMIVKLKK